MSRKLRVLVGCEESQTITKAFRQLGHEAYSCDLQPCSGGHPEWHIQTDILEVIKLQVWDLAIFHPDCTYLTVSANKWFKDQPERKSGTLVGEARRQAREDAVEFFMKLYNCNIPHIAVENPIGVMSSRFRKPDCIIQPWQFGHGETKATCLWLKNLPTLNPTNIVEERVQRLHRLPPSVDRAKLRSKTYEGVGESNCKSVVRIHIKLMKDKKYKITQEQFDRMKHYRSMFNHNAEEIERLCASEKDDIVYGYELGKMYTHLRDCFMGMMDLEDEIKSENN